MTRGPNPIVVGISVLKSLLAVRSPRPSGAGVLSHEALRPPLNRLAGGGSGALGQLEPELAAYLDELRRHDPDRLTRDEALAFWINLYNAGALILAGQAQRTGEDSVMAVPGGFRSDFISIDGESLSLDDIEHGKLRRFQDPRIHAALVCGSVSCPTLRGDPYIGTGLNEQLDDQLRYFLTAGGCSVDRTEGVVLLSRVFLWFGADFVRPNRMPTFRPVSRSSTLSALTPWLDPETVDWIASARPDVQFQSYDWGLRCVVR